ncbi:site-specific integrase [Pediococcus ethanolidurans]|uniref:tyrosine-type recombinase/integrase n=1 Tax=Pediococcus ethanolidurans TaxID=319653 RepID=UPI0021E6E89A|nr:site-specific integrase [Pediococcus ethanolidurans]MCV3320778.1 site-specific integrase [Pediococcus ethanolidurans]MCV3327705.1 site-specific integrase [Pediococcus ethanolidurans]
MASIKKDKNGKWQARVSIKDKNGKFKTVANRFRTKDEAVIFASKIETDKYNGNLFGEKDITLPEYFKQWYETYRTPKISKATERSYKHSYNVLNNYFKLTPITDLKRSDYQNFVSDYGKEHAPKTVKRVNNFVKSCVKDAIYDETIKKDFTHNITFVANKDKIVKVEYLNIKEIKKLLNYMLNDLSLNKMSHYMILTALFTGARLSEIAGLTWRDINFNFNAITINKSFDYLNPKKFKPTKTESSNRVIRINPEFTQILKDLKKERNGRANNLVFGKLNDAIPPSSNGVNHALNHALMALKIKRHNFHFHSLRHSHVAFLLSRGVDIQAISKRLGHSSVTITMNVYAYLLDETKKKNDQLISDSLDTLMDKEYKHMQKM